MPRRHRGPSKKKRGPPFEHAPVQMVTLALAAPSCGSSLLSVMCIKPFSAPQRCSRSPIPATFVGPGSPSTSLITMRVPGKWYQPASRLQSLED